MTRLIDADALKANEAHYDEEGVRIFYENEIDNAEPVEPEITNDDLQAAMTESYHLGYELAETKFKRPHGEWIKKVDDVGFVSHNYEEIDRNEILEAVHILDIFTKTYCRYRNDYERFNDLAFRCDECPFQKEKKYCQVKEFKNRYAPDYKDFGCMGDL